ncbi:MAG TPA: hypothetical protein PLO23_03275 [Alphaproteobacteria bacterium]|nr:hypothetical protein [Alphaproteobacteria bacterium]
MTDTNFSPPHFPLTLRAAPLMGTNLAFKYLPHASAGLVALGYSLQSIIGSTTADGQYMTALAEGACYGTAAFTTMISAFAYAADRGARRHYHTVEMTDKGFVVNEFTMDNKPSSTTVIDPTGYRAGIYAPFAWGPYMPALLPEKGGQPVVVSPPLEYGEAFQVAEMLNDAIDYFNAPYHLRDGLKQRLTDEFAERWSGIIAPSPEHVL